MASSTKAADSNIEIKRYAALGGAFGTSAVRLCLPRRQEEPDTGWEVHCLLGARWPPKIRRTLKQKQVAKHPKIRLKIRFWKNFEVANGHHKVKPRHAGDVTWNVSTNVGILWCDGLRIAMLDSVPMFANTSNQLLTRSTSTPKPATTTHLADHLHSQKVPGRPEQHPLQGSKQ